MSASAMTGLEFWLALLDRPARGMAELLEFRLTEVEAGRVVVEGTPSERHANPIGLVHGGYAATLLDSAMGAAVMTRLGAGKAFNTIETQVHFVRPITEETGVVRAEGRALHVGSRVGTAEGRLLDAGGKLYAHGTTSVLVVSL